MRSKLLKWLFAGALLATFPLVAHYLCLDVKGLTPSLSSVIGRGELLLLAAALAATGIGDLATAGPGLRDWKIVCASCATMVFGISCILYASIAHACSAASPPEPQLVASRSLVLYFSATGALSDLGVILSEFVSGSGVLAGS